MSRQSFSAALLAGGRSRRMGHDKALLKFNGTRLLDHQLATLRGIHPQELLLSCRAGAAYEAPGAKIVFDEQEDAGPLGGITACLAAMPSERLLVLAVDMPCMTSEFLESLLHFSGGVIPRSKDRYEPLAAIYPRSMLASARENLAKGQNALHVWIEQGVREGFLESCEITHDDRILFANWNEPSGDGGTTSVSSFPA